MDVLRQDDVVGDDEQTTAADPPQRISAPAASAVADEPLA